MWLFPQLLVITRRWIRECVRLKDDTWLGLLLFGEWKQEAAEKIYRAIVRSAGGEPRIRPILAPYDTVGGTRHVSFDTSKKTMTTRPDRSHVSHVVLDSFDWEAKVAESIESMDEVRCYVKNDRLGFTMPYSIGGEEHRYVPDYLVKVDGLTLVVEVSGRRKKEKEAKVATAQDFLDSRGEQPRRVRPLGVLRDHRSLEHQDRAARVSLELDHGPPCMTPEELATLVGGRESHELEFKRSTGQRSEAAKAACGMLNGSGGQVLFGIEPDGTICGQDFGHDTLDDIAHELRKIDPQVPINPEVVTLDTGRCVIVLNVPVGSGGPYRYEGRPYVRMGSTTVVMGHEELERQVLARREPANRWESQPSRVRLDALDLAEIVRTTDEGIRRARLIDPGTRDPLDLLRGLGLTTDGAAFINAAVPLFGRGDRLLPGYPQRQLRMARFRGTTTAEFEDNRHALGHIFELMQLAQSFLRIHLPVAGKVVPSLFERVDDPLYPLEALREALANAFCHRDYQLAGGAVTLAVFDDRLEITSTGSLPRGVRLADLGRPHSSHPRNPSIAYVMYRRGLIEQWGRGTLKIRELVERAGLPSPEFEERTGELVVRFFSDAIRRAAADRTPPH